MPVDPAKAVRLREGTARAVARALRAVPGGQPGDPESPRAKHPAEPPPLPSGNGQGGEKQP
jgi:hypothetical protein